MAIVLLSSYWIASSAVSIIMTAMLFLSLSMSKVSSRARLWPISDHRSWVINDRRADRKTLTGAVKVWMQYYT